MKSVRFVLPALLLTVSIAASARSETPPNLPETLARILKPNDYVSLTTSSSGMYQLRILATGELDSIRKAIKDGSVKQQEYESKRKELLELRNKIIAEGRDGTAKDAASPGERMSKLTEEVRKLKQPSVPPTPYRVLMVGTDYVAVTDEQEEIIIPLDSILDIRRTMSPKE